MLFEALYLGLIVSIVTFGISNASAKGALLSPLYEWITSKDNAIRISLQEKINDAKDKWAELLNLPTERKKALPNLQEQEAVFRSNIDTYLMQIAQVGFWKKPLITCVKCMPSVWVIPLYFISDSQADIPALFVAVCFASVLNTVLVRHYPIDK